MKLFNKFVSIISLFVITILIVFGLNMINISKKALEETILQRHLFTATSVGNLIEDYVKKLNLSLGFAVMLERFPDISWNEKHKILLEALLRNKDFILVTLIDKNNKKLIEVCSPDYYHSKDYLEKQTTKQIFLKAKLTQQPQLGKVYYIKEFPRLDIVYPLTKLNQYVFITVGLNSLWKKISNIKIGRTGFVCLIDETGRLFFHPITKNAMNSIDISNLSITKKLLDTKSKGTVKFKNLNNVEFVGAYYWLKSTKWGIIIRQEVKEAYRSVTLLRQQALLLIIIGIIFSILISLFLAKGMTKSISFLVAAVERLGEGNLDQQITMKTKDEISFLAKRFNDMLKKLKEYQEKLVSSEKLAAIGQMANVVGHEIRNPLGAINNAIYYIKSKISKDDEKLQKHTGIIEREISNATKIINDLLGFSRTRPPVKQKVNLNMLIEEALSVSPPPSYVEVKKIFNPKLPQVLVSPDEMRQVILNLINNAYHAISKTGSLTVTTDILDNSVIMKFKDTGCGIPQENLSKIFEPFFTTKSQGTGLGLSTVKRIIERHNGSLKVESKVDYGTTFTIFLRI